MDKFGQRKKEILSKKDKSSKGSWDKHILKLCDKINKKKNYYTTSSCSGRLTIIRNVLRAKRGVVLKSYHDALNYSDFKKDLDEFLKKEKGIVIKFEPPIIHIACKDIHSMKELYETAKNSGWKNIGAISFESRYILEAKCSDRLEFPVVCDNKLIVDDKFFQICIKESNIKLKNCWKKINKFEQMIK